MKQSFQHLEILPDIATPTLFLPGWGFDGRILTLSNPTPRWLSPYTFIDPETIEMELLQLVAANNISKFRLIGWSMGAMLGLEFAAKHPDLIDSLVLIALRSLWPAQQINEIRSAFSLDPEGFLKGFYRKCFLGNKQLFRDFCGNLEPSMLSAAKTQEKRLMRGLDFLARFTVPDPLPGMDTRLIHGGQDIITPFEERPTLPDASVETIDSAGHMVFLHGACSLQHELKKEAIQAKFSRAAESYDQFAKVQSEVARRLATKLPLPQEKPAIRNILEIGCGTGNFTQLLARRYPSARITALDFSPEMVAKARTKLTGNTVAFVCAEAERFLETTWDNSYDLVASNGSLQWFSDIDKALGNIRRILTTGGRTCCSIFGPESLTELAQGLHAILHPVERIAAETFPQRDRLVQTLRTIFEEGKVEEVLVEKKYRSAHDLLRHIQKTGTSGWQQKLLVPLTPSRVKELDAWFHRTYGYCKATYQILFLYGKR